MADRYETLILAARVALVEMCNTVAPRHSFTDAVDALDSALSGVGASPFTKPEWSAALDSRAPQEAPVKESAENFTTTPAVKEAQPSSRAPQGWQPPNGLYVNVNRDELADCMVAIERAAWSRAFRPLRAARARLQEIIGVNLATSRRQLDREASLPLSPPPEPSEER
jgi:hypothetical protein